MSTGSDGRIRLTGIHLYPLKSAAAFSVHDARVDRLGLSGDRRWMLVDDDGHALTQREVPRLARIHAVPADGALDVVVLGMPPLEVPIPSPGAESVRATIHTRTALGAAAGDEADGWFSEFLERRCRLLYLPPELAIAVAPPWGGSHDRTAFTDGFPVLLIGESSLNELNRRLARSVPMDRFRPNLVVSGSEPFEEDAWDEVMIGGLNFRAVKPCPRCVVTTVDQATGVRDPSGEPLATLASFRKWDGKVWFGMNLLSAGAGSVRLADPVEVVSRRDAQAG